MPAYDSNWFVPPAPFEYVTLRDPDSGLEWFDVPMLLDTGADTTLLPRAAVTALGIAVVEGRQYEVVGFDGQSSLAAVVRLEMLFLGRTFRGQFLVLPQDWGIIGRNVLNALPLILDGPNLMWDEYKPASQPSPLIEEDV
jgi:predicted aspartyl protease